MACASSNTFGLRSTGARVPQRRKLVAVHNSEVQADLPCTTLRPQGGASTLTSIVIDTLVNVVVLTGDLPFCLTALASKIQ